MPEYLSPGVYIEEIESGAQPIEGVSTSIAGAVGVTAMGPTSGKPVLVTSFADFARTFGGFTGPPKDPTDPGKIDMAMVNRWTYSTDGGQFWNFPLAVQGFFAQGGQQLYVKRVFSSTSVAASASFGTGLVSTLTRDADLGATTLQVEHLFGIATGTQVTIWQGNTNTQVGGTFQVTSYDPRANFITLNGQLPAPVRSGSDYVAITAPSAKSTTLIFTAQGRGVSGNDLSVKVRPIVGNTFSLLANPTLPNFGPPVVTSIVKATPNTANHTWTLQVASVAGLNNPNQTVLIDGNPYVISGVDTTAVTITIPAPKDGGEAFLPGTAVKALRAANVPAPLTQAQSTLYIWGAAQLYPNALVEVDNGQKKEVCTVVSVSGNQVNLSPALKQSYLEGDRIRVVEAEVGVTYAPGGVVAATETFTGLRLFADNNPDYLVNLVNSASKLITATKADGYSWSILSAFPTAASGPTRSGFLPLAGGDDKLSDLSIDDFIGFDPGNSAGRTGIQSLEDIDEISICMVPTLWSPTVQQALIQHCETLRDRFAILDPPIGLDIGGIMDYRATFDTEFAALYYPWIDVMDPLSKSVVSIAPAGYMAGIYARVDVARGVHKAPANEVISGITQLAADVNKREQDLLNPLGINALRFFPDRGNRVWGARTLSSDSSWKYINVRRLFIYVETSIQKGTQWVVFEPNAEPLWARVVQTITNFLMTVWIGGALQGTKASEAFFVQCDRTTMSQDDIDNGRLICIVGIAPVKPAEFVIFRIQQMTLQAST